VKELLYTVLELEEWHREIENLPCEFCTVLFSNRNKAVCQIRTRSKITHKIVESDFVCQECKEKFENDQIPKCERCGRLRTKSDTDVITGEYVCRCIKRKENTEEKELPVLPHEEREATFYERQINALREEKDQLTEEVETHLEALEVSEVWNKRQKRELLDKVSDLEKKIKQLEEENKQLKEQQTTQVEIKTEKKLRFLPFGRKS